MAKYKNKPYEMVEHNGEMVRKYADGSLRNERGHPVPGVAIPSPFAITPENARQMQARWRAIKYQVMADAANSEVQPELLAKYGDMAHVAERAITLQRIATTPEAGKAAVMAHSALTLDTGMAEPRGVETPTGTANDTAEVIGAVSELLSNIRALAHGFDNSKYHNHAADVVDAEAEAGEG